MERVETAGALVVGAGGFAREAAETARAIHSVDGSVRLLGFLDDDRSLHGTTVGGVPVLGPHHEHDATYVGKRQRVPQ